MIALAAVGRERENPRSERSEPAALKVQLVEVGGFFSATMPLIEPVGKLGSPFLN